jgi:hypothetical protein
MTNTRVLIGCEFSGTVREAFRRRGHDAWSCDLLAAEDGSQFHIQGDVRRILHEGWDLGVFFPPCTHLCVSGARWFPQKLEEQQDALDFIARLMVSPIPRTAIENPIGIISTKLRKPDQIIQPWQFGHGETKATCLWLKNLAPLKPTNTVEGREQRLWRTPPSETRWMIRSRTYRGIADAMAEQWGGAK